MLRNFVKRLMMIFLVVVLFISSYTVGLTLTKQVDSKSSITVYSGNTETDRYIVKYKSSAGRDKVKKLKGDIVSVKKAKDQRFDTIKTKSKMKTKDLVTILKDAGADADIEYIQPDYEMITSSTDPSYEEQWGLYNEDSGLPDFSSLPDDETVRKFILEDAEIMGIPSIRIDANVPDAWTTTQDKNIIVAVIDTGVDINQEDLTSNIFLNIDEIPGNGKDDDANGYIDDVSGWNFSEKTNQVYDINDSSSEWHGTHIAGIIGASKDNSIGITGAAPEVKILPLKVFHDGVAYTSDIIDAIKYAESMGAKIANCSWGTTSYNPALEEAIEQSNMTFICAAGNSHMDIDNNPVYPASFDLPNIITVASIGKNGALSSFSNYGVNCVDVAAPGEDIISTLPGNKYGKSSGTSMAAAFVAGEVALLLGDNSGLTPSEIKDRIKISSDKLSSLSNKTSSGGKINCTSAVKNISADTIIKITAPESDSVPASGQGSDGYTLSAADSWTGKAAMPTARRNFGAVEANGFIYAVGGYSTSFLNKVEEYDPYLNTWATKAVMPTARENLCVVALLGKIYAIGGYNGSYLNTVEEYDQSTNTWTTKAAMPTARRDAGAAVINGKIYVVGGYNGSYINTVEEYNPATNTWSTMASMLTPRSRLGVQSVNGKLYAIGGYAYGHLNSVQEYDPMTNTWDVKRSMPTTRSDVITSVANNKIYIMGGTNGSSLNTVEEYNPALDVWVSKTNMTTARAQGSAAVLNDCIYILGGYNGSNLNINEAYIPSTDVWILKTPAPTARAQCGTAVVGSRIYVAGGTSVGNSSSYYVEQNTFEEYNCDTNTWTVKASMPTARFGCGSVTLNGKVYVLGWWSWSTLGFWELTKVEMYDPATNTWSTKADMINSRYAGAYAVFGGKIYAFGGYTSETVEMYDPASNTWTQKASMSGRRYTHTAAVVNDKIYIIGGNDGSSMLNTVEEYDPATDTWCAKASMPTPRGYLGAVAINNVIYAIGGMNKGFLSTTEIYDPANNKWTSAPGMAVGRMRLGTAAVSGKIYAIDGYKGTDTYLNTVEEYIAEFDKYIVQAHFGEEDINPASGNFSRSYTDMQTQAPGFQVNISRTYNSKDDRIGPLGKGWTFGFEGNIKSDTSNPLYKVATLPNGSVMTFYTSDNVNFTALDSRSKLVYSGGLYILTTKDQYKYTFNSNGWLSSMQDRNGNIVSISVDSTGKISTITDNAGRSFTVDYAGTNYIRFVRDSASSRVVEYQYNANNQLIKAIDPMGNDMNYYYDSTGLLKEIKDKDNQNRLEYIFYYTYGENKNKVRQLTDINGNTFTYAYDKANRATSITDSYGRQTVKYYDSHMYVTSEKDSEGRFTYTEYFTDAYGSNSLGEEKSVTDRYGNKTTYERDSMGNITKIINPDLSFKEYTYDSNNNMTSEKDENGKYTFYIYDSSMKLLVKKVQPLNGTDPYFTGCNEANFAITTYNYYSDLEATQRGYMAKGLLKSVVDAENNETVYTYDSYGYLKTVSDPETGKVTAYETNSIGWRTAEITPRMFRTEYVYDSNGRIEKKVLNGNEITRYVYDSMGRKIKEVSPNLYNASHDNLNAHAYSGEYGYRYTYYPSGKMKTMLDPENNLTTYYYDLYGNLTKEVKNNGNTIYEYEYDVMNRLKKVSFKNGEAAQSEVLEEYAYSVLADKKTQKTFTRYLNSTETAVTTYKYDYAGRLVEQLNADNTTIINKYNSNGTLDSTTGTNNATTYYRYDGMNRLTEQWAPLETSGSYTFYAYTKTEYDKANRCIAIKESKEKVICYAIPSTFITTSYTYYKNGKIKSMIVTNEANNEIQRTAYGYDDDGYVNKEESYSNASTANIVEYTNNHLGKPVEKKVHIKLGDLYGNDISNAQDSLLITTYTYDKNGNLKTEKTPDYATSPGNVTITYDYDNLDRQISVSQPGTDENGNSVIVMKSLTYNWDGKPIEIKDAKGNITRNTYSTRGFLEKVTNTVTMDGVLTDCIEAYEYDRAGRKIAEISPKNYDATKTKVTEMDNRTVYMYDKMDRVILKTFVGKEKRFAPATGIWSDSNVSIVIAAYKYDNSGNVVKELNALGYEAGTGTDVNAMITSGYGTEYTYNLANRLVTVLDPVLKDRGLSYSIKNDYDALLRKTSEVRATGIVNNYYYDGNGNVISIKVKKTINDPEQTIESNTYDYLNNLKTHTDGNNNTTTYEYNAFNKIRKIVYPGDQTIPSNTVTQQYDVLGNLKLMQDTAGTVDLYSYDNLSRLSSQIEQKSDGTQAITKSYAYDVNGNVRFETDGNNVRKEKNYDEFNRLITERVTVSGLLRTTSYSYDKNNNLISTTDWNNNSWTNLYDALNRLYEKSDPSTTVIQRLEYNHNSVQVNSYDALNQLTQFSYDKNNRLLITTDSELHKIEQTYDNDGNIDSREDGEHHVTRYYYDEFNRLKSVQNAKNEYTTYSYDMNGNMLSQTDGKNQTTVFEYNVMNKMTKKIDYGGRTGSQGNYIYDSTKVEEYSYYSTGDLKSKIDRNGKTTYYVYDSHHQLLSQTIGTTSISYTYDNNGNQKTMTDSTGVTTWFYDEMNRVTAKTVPNFGTTSFAYDLTTGLTAGYSAETTTDYKANVTKKVYDKVGRIKQVIADGKTTTYNYYSNGNKMNVIYPDNTKQEYTYYSDNLIHTLVTTKPDLSNMDSYIYTYDGAHNQLTKYEKINGVEKGTTVYTYDDLNRLETVTEPSVSGKVTTYAYDGAGNRETETVVIGTNSIQMVYAYNEQNRLMSTTTTQVNGTQEITKYNYDNNGNLVYKGKEVIKTSDPQDSSSHGLFVVGNSLDDFSTSMGIYEYDDWNQLISATTGDKTETYVNNGMGYRVQKTANGQTSRFLYEYDKVILETGTDGTQKAWNVYGTNLISRKMSSVTAYYIYNGHGDVTALLNTTGSVLATYYYDAFGNILEKDENAGISNPFRYAGYQLDDTGLYYLNSRYYDSVTARFITEDTYRGQVNDPLSLNLYIYCTNNPVIYFDPTGHWKKSDAKLNDEAQAELIALTSAYKYAKTKEEKQEIKEQAEDIRNDPDSKEKRDTLVEIDDEKQVAFNKAVKKAYSDGKMTKKEWNNCLKALDASVTTSSTKTSSYSVEINTTNTTTTIGKTDISVQTNVTTYKYTNQVSSDINVETTTHYSAYVLYLPEWKNEVDDIVRDLTSCYEIDENDIGIASVSNPDELKDSWNMMGLTSEGNNITAVVMDTHGSPYGLSFGDRDNDKETDTNERFTNSQISSLGSKNIDKLILLGCNTGHLDYREDNPAALFSQKVNGGRVLASDGTVYTQIPALGWLLGVGGDYSYSSVRDTKFDLYSKTRNGSRYHDNEGWFIFQYSNGKVNISDGGMGDKTLKMQDMFWILK